MYSGVRLRVLYVCVHACTHAYIYHLGIIYEGCQESLSNSYGQDCAELQFGSRRGMFMLSHSLTVSISHSFLIILFLRKDFYICLSNLYFHCWLFHSAVKPTDFSRKMLILSVHQCKKRLQKWEPKRLGNDQGGQCSSKDTGWQLKV